MVACGNWAPSLKFRVSSAFAPGDYLIKLVGSGRQQSYIPLTVWDPASTATYVIKNAVLSWQAWNPYGGYDFFQGAGACPARAAAILRRITGNILRVFGQGPRGCCGPRCPTRTR